MKMQLNQATSSFQTNRSRYELNVGDGDHSGQQRTGALRLLHNDSEGCGVFDSAVSVLQRLAATALLCQAATADTTRLLATVEESLKYYNRSGKLSPFDLMCTDELLQANRLR